MPYVNRLIYCATPSRLSYLKDKIMDFVIKKGQAPLHPFQAFPYHLFEGGKIGRKSTLRLCERLIQSCDEVWVFGKSEGVDIEIKYANLIGRKVKEVRLK